MHSETNSKLSEIFQERERAGMVHSSFPAASQGIKRARTGKKERCGGASTPSSCDIEPRRRVDSMATFEAGVTCDSPRHPAVIVPEMK